MQSARSLLSWRCRGQRAPALRASISSGMPTSPWAVKFGGDGSAVFRPGERISTPGLLRGMVEQCNTELGLGLFPEEVTAIAAVLQRDHYRFK